MAMPFHIDYRVHEHGWASVAFPHWPDWPQDERFAVSHLRDALTELTQAACQVLQPGSLLTPWPIRFWDEPGELALTLHTGATAECMRLHLAEHSRWDAPDDAVPVRDFGHQSMTRVAFAHGVCTCLDRILDELSPADFEARWRHPYPDAQHAQLRDLLRTHFPR